jgi:hypothetical protein
MPQSDMLDIISSKFSVECAHCEDETVHDVLQRNPGFENDAAMKKYLQGEGFQGTDG